jgi:hypothetical protein
MEAHVRDADAHVERARRWSADGRNERKERWKP